MITQNERVNFQRPHRSYLFTTRTFMRLRTSNPLTTWAKMVWSPKTVLSGERLKLRSFIASCTSVMGHLWESKESNTIEPRARTKSDVKLAAIGIGLSFVAHRYHASLIVLQMRKFVLKSWSALTFPTHSDIALLEVYHPEERDHNVPSIRDMSIVS